MSVTVCLSSFLSVCLSVRTLKRKRLELQTLKSAYKDPHEGQKVKGQRSRSHGYEVCRRGYACRYDCFCFLVIYEAGYLWHILWSSSAVYPVTRYFNGKNHIAYRFRGQDKYFCHHCLKKNVFRALIAGQNSTELLNSIFT